MVHSFDTFHNVPIIKKMYFHLENFNLRKNVERSNK